MISGLNLNAYFASFRLAVCIKSEQEEIISIVMKYSFNCMAAKQHLPLDKIHAQISNDMFSCTSFSH